MTSQCYPFLRHYLSNWDPDDETVTLVIHGHVPRMPPSHVTSRVPLMHSVVALSRAPPIESLPLRSAA